MMPQQVAKDGGAATETAMGSQTLACWSRAWTQMTQGMLAVASAEMQFAREVFGPPLPLGEVHFNGLDATAHAWVRLSKQRFDGGMQALRKMTTSSQPPCSRRPTHWPAA